VPTLVIECGTTLLLYVIDEVKSYRLSCRRGVLLCVMLLCCYVGVVVFRFGCGAVQWRRLACVLLRRHHSYNLLHFDLRRHCHRIETRMSGRLFTEQVARREPPSHFRFVSVGVGI